MDGTINVDREKCCYCGGCVAVCPADALFLMDTELRVDREKCTLCAECEIFCPVQAIYLSARKKKSPAPETISVDVVVVGAGPAGSICAKHLAQSGIRVVVVEKRQEIGAPKRCAEGLSPNIFKDVGVKIDPLWVTNRIQGAILYAPDRKGVRLHPSSPEDYMLVIERKVFEKHLARDAILAGAHYLIKTAAVGIIKNGETVKGIQADHMGDKKTILARIVIAADGVDSMVARWAGINTVNKLEDCLSCFQYEMAGLRNIDEAAAHLYFGNRVAPGGYAWIFPKGNSMANVGLGIKTQKAAEKNPKYYLDAFIQNHPAIFDRACAVEVNCGGVPVKPWIKTLVGDGLMVIGDAGHLVNPATGGGIKLAMISGKMAAEVAVEALRKNSVSRKSLSLYEKRWQARHSQKFKRMLRLQRFKESLSDEDLNRLASLITGKTLEELSRGSFSGLVKILVKKSPQLAGYALKYFKS